MGPADHDRVVMPKYYMDIEYRLRDCTIRTPTDLKGEQEASESSQQVLSSPVQSYRRQEHVDDGRNYN